MMLSIMALNLNSDRLSKYPQGTPKIQPIIVAKRAEDADTKIECHTAPSLIVAIRFFRR